MNVLLNHTFTKGDILIADGFVDKGHGVFIKGMYVVYHVKGGMRLEEFQGFDEPDVVLGDFTKEEDIVSFVNK